MDNISIIVLFYARIYILIISRAVKTSHFSFIQGSRGPSKHWGLYLISQEMPETILCTIIDTGEQEALVKCSAQLLHVGQEF